MWQRPSCGGARVDWKSALVSFFIVFASELGDKTQLATMAVAAQSRSPVMVFVGAAGALVLSALLGVAVGDAVTRLIPLHILRTGAGLAFVLFGILLIAGRG